MKFCELNNGYKIPAVGLGMFKMSHDEGIACVKNAIDVGYRHFDTAWIYGNEEQLGIAIQDKIQEGVVKREDLFITTKLWNNFHTKEKVLPMLKEQLSKLKMDYVDLYLMHWPFGFQEDAEDFPMDNESKAYSDVDYLDTWEAMEEASRQGLARSIGISNFNSKQIARLLKVAKIQPAVNQVEIHPKLNQKKMIEFCRKNNIVCVGYSPLAQCTAISCVFDKKVEEIGRKYKKTSAQVILNYLVSLGICVIPKTENKVRMLENISILDFTLNTKEICYMDSLNTNERQNMWEMVSDHEYYPFNIEF